MTYVSHNSFVDINPGRARIPQHWPEPVRPSALGDVDHPTPYLICDLETVRLRYRAFSWALPDVQTYYAVKCNASPEILSTLAEMGC